MTTALLTVVAILPAAADPAEFQLDNGLRVLLLSQPDQPLAVVALGVRTGVDDEPEGRNGLAHLAEHIFLNGGAGASPPYQAFKALTRQGPTGKPYQDVNAETLWNLTYYYAACPPQSIDLALETFAEKLGGVSIAPELLTAEKTKVLVEIDQAARNLEKFPLMKLRLADLHRRPKAGAKPEVEALTAEHVAGFLATHHRPDRAILIVAGDFDATDAQARINDLFGPVRAQNQVEPKPPPAESPPPAADRREQLVAFYRLDPRTTPREHAALKVAGQAWQTQLRKAQAGAYVEIAPDRGHLRVILPAADAALLRKTRDTLAKPLDEALFKRARARAASAAQNLKTTLAVQQLIPGRTTLEASAQRLVQTCINRLLFEAEGGEAFLDLLETLDPQQVANAARKRLTSVTEPDGPPAPYESVDQPDNRSGRARQVLDPQ